MTQPAFARNSAYIGRFGGNRSPLYTIYLYGILLDEYLLSYNRYWLPDIAVLFSLKNSRNGGIFIVPPPPHPEAQFNVNKLLISRLR